ncbi:MAG: nicotinate-nucleotide adenylyltransferase [Pseudomonadota bacterium]
MKLGETKAGGTADAVLRDVARMPPVARGLRIGLYGGSFNPAHATHRAVSLLALKRLGLDRVWWLVTPGNPLKDNRRLPPLDERVAYAREVACHPRIDVTGIEAVLGTRYTYETVERLVSRAPGVHFVWVMGADNLTHFHRWQRWRALADMLPIAVVDRMGESLSATASRAARALGRHRVEESDAGILPLLKPPAWVFLHGLKSPMSSTGIRAKLAGGNGGWRGPVG